jgi:hypothetical protein
MAARRRSQQTGDLERNVRKLGRQLPAPVQRILRQLARNLREAQRQIDAARAERDVRWRKLQKQLRGDAARLLRQLRQAVGPARTSARRARPAGGRARSARKK